MSRSTPGATYRVQLHPAFGFDSAAGIADYLAQLGVTHLYCSPYFQACRGSTHGYDVADHSQINTELGGEPAHERMCRALAANSLGQILDIIPNHMAASAADNPWWRDVLANGPESRYASFFDIDWDPPDQKLKRKILVPVLADHYGRVLEKGELELVREDGNFVVRYHEHSFPLSPASAAALERDPGAVERVNRDKQALHRLLDRQHYRLAYWRAGDRELNYRRFFDIKSLVALRVERVEVFDAVHALALDLVERGFVDGLRVDHVDGLRAPRRYLERLRSQAPTASVYVEKILEPGEELRRDWPVEGTTGYEFAALVGGLFVHPTSEGDFTRLYQRFTGIDATVGEMTREKKLLVMQEILVSDLKRLAEAFVDVCERHLAYRDYTRWELSEALLETIAAFPVYRTYAEPETGRVSEQDEAYVEEALRRVQAARPDLDPDLLALLADILLLRQTGGKEAELIVRFQQLTGPAMAKGFEDTVLYNYNRLVSLNEVGGDPGKWGVSVDEFHEHNARAARDRPNTLLATSTHDTKRSEDVRARLNLLSEIPEHWARAVERWSAMNERHRTSGLPDRNIEYLLYQTLVGAFPLELERAWAYIEKAAREAKVHTSWLQPNERYERALRDFVEGTLGGGEFSRSLRDFVGPLVRPGRVNSLAQTLLKLASPGVPDLYQGSELWDLSLVDPDNRRPVDYETRRELLALLKDGSPEDAWSREDDGGPKLFLIHRALKLRRERAHAFAGEYRPLAATGERAAHVVALERGGEVIAVAPRLVLSLGGDWGDTRLDLPPGRWENVLTAEQPEATVAIGDLLRRFPVALLALVDAGGASPRGAS